MKKATAVVLALLGVAAVVSVPFIVGVDATVDAIRRVGWTGVLLFVANASLILLAPGTGWWLLMRGAGIRVSLGQTLAACVMGFPINLLTPSAQLGAEPLKAVYIARVSGAAPSSVLATIVVSKVQEAVGLVLVALTSVAILVAAGTLTPAQRLTAGIVTGSLALALALVIVGFCLDAKPTVRIVNLLACLPFRRRRMARLRRSARRMEAAIRASFVERPGRFLLAQGITLLSAPSNFFRPALFLAFSGGAAITPTFLAAAFLVMNGLNMISFTPGGLGIFEGGMIGAFAAAGLGKETGAAYALVGRISDVTLVMIGTALMAATGARRLVKA